MDHATENAENAGVVAAPADTAAVDQGPGFTEADTIHITADAAENIVELAKEYGEEGWGLRFGLTGGGCSGYKYVLEFEESAADDDLVFGQGEVRVFVSREHMAKLKNSTIGWKDDMMAAGFEIENPQAKRPCGCGASVDF
ncbi:MAG: iron-sulfur cluster assembly accessory protein [Deltaproteobacteria bacterium]|nr:iron-sulfur cluster assembly accessory protein [Deltaproteobacteria bacterium]